MDKFIQSQHQLNLYNTIVGGPSTLEITISDYVALLLPLVGFFSYLSYGKLWFKPDPYLYKLYERPQAQAGFISQYSGPKDITKQLQDQKSDAVIFWGSQSGTAERLAHRLARDCAQRFGLNTIVADLSDYDHETIASISNDKFAMFLLSTFGEGDPSDNTAEFLNWLKDRSQALTNLRYAAFGLGNSNYVYYNKVVNDVVGYFEKLSAESLLPVGRADDADGATEEDFISWKDDLFSMFHTRLGLEERVLQYVSSIEVTELTEAVGLSEVQFHIGEPLPLKLSRRAARNYSTIQKLPIKEARVLTTGHSTDRSCLHLEIDIRENRQMKYKTGDHLAVWPVNAEQEVERMLNVLNLADKKNAEIIISAKKAGDEELKIPRRSTIFALFQNYLEISAPVSRDTIFGLCHLAPSEAIKSFLQDLSKKSAYATFIARNHVTLARLLEHTLPYDSSVDWAHLPLAFVIESLRPMTPRYYSISSSSASSSRQMSITVAVSPMQLAANPGVTISGLTTSYLSAVSSTSSASLYGHVRRSTFKLPFLHKTSIVLIASGSGIAPFRGFLQERAQMAQISNQEIGPVLLVFGCRNPDQDYLYRAEIEAFQQGPLRGKFEIVNAFSRVPGQKKCYVQDRLGETGTKQKVARMLCRDEATLYFCGSASMARAAGKVVCSGVKEHEQQTDEDHKAWVEMMKRSRRWQEDVWG